MDTVALESLDSPIGTVIVAATEIGISGVAFGEGDRERLTAGLAEVAEVGGGGLASLARARLTAYFAGDLRVFDLPVDWRFVRSRLGREALGVLYATVRFGATVTYGELAGRVSELRGGRTVPARAIGSAMGANPIPIIVPCHRVLAGNGLGGYSGGSGLDVKRHLLALEGVLPPTLDFES